MLDVWANLNPTEHSALTCNVSFRLARFVHRVKTTVGCYDDCAMLQQRHTVDFCVKLHARPGFLKAFCIESDVIFIATVQLLADESHTSDLST